MRRSHIMLASACAAGLVLTGCTTGAGDNAAAQSEGMSTDTIRTTVEQPGTFDPTQVRSLPDFLMARLSYDTLLRKDAEGKLTGGLATEWTFDGTQGVFTLREGATCADGTPITATIVKNSLEYLTDPQTMSQVVPKMFGPQGNPVFEADDEAGTVTVKLEQPWPDLPIGLSVASTGIICPSGLEDPEALAQGNAEGAESGPYLLSEKEHAVRYAFELREDYSAWPEYSEEIDGVPADKFVYNIMPDRNATANQLVSGQIDIGVIEPNAIERFEKMSGFSVESNPFTEFYLVFNQREGSPFADPEVRKAVAQALNRETFEEITSSGHGLVATHMATPGVVCSDQENAPAFSYEPEAAADVLEGVKIRLLGSQIVGPQGSGNVYIQEQLRAAGADVQLDNLDVGGWASRTFGEPSAWDVTVFADLNFMGTLANQLTFFTGPIMQEGGSNLGKAHNEKTEQLLAESMTMTESEERCAALDEAMDSLVAEADGVPLATAPRVLALAEGFGMTQFPGALDDPIFRITK